MSDGELKKYIKTLKYGVEPPVIKELLHMVDEAKTDIPKKYITTDYTHFFEGDEELLDKGEPLPDHDYPRYVHEPSNDDWEKWFKKWFGESK